MPKSGITCDTSVIEAFNAFKMDNKTKLYDFLIMKIDLEAGKILLDESPPAGSCAEEAGEEFVGKIPASYKKLVDLLLKKHCRYAFYTFHWRQSDGERSMVVFIQYCDDNAPDASLKMKYASTKSSIKNGCKGFQADVEANDKDDLDYFAIIDKVSKGKALK